MGKHWNKFILTLSVFSSVAPPRILWVVRLPVSIKLLSGTCRYDLENSWRALTSTLPSSLFSDPVKDRERIRYSINPLAWGVEITRPSGLVAESLGDLRPTIGDKSNSGSEQLRPWISGLLMFVIGRSISGGVWKSSLEEDSLDGACFALRNLARALCNLWYCWSVTLEMIWSSLDLQEFDLEAGFERSASKIPLPLLEKLLSRLTEFEAPNSTLLKLLSRLTVAPELASPAALFSILKLTGMVSELFCASWLLISSKT